MLSSLTIMDLWLPIFLSAVAVFIAGAMAWTVLPHHRKDWAKLPSEESVLAGLRGSGAPPGQYRFPYCANPAELKDPQVKQRYEAGPHGVLFLSPGPPGMGLKMALNFLFNVTVGVFVAYLASRTLVRGAAFLDVFQIAGTAGVMAFSFGGIPYGIWFGRTWRSMAMDFMDGVFEGLVMGAIFAALWP